MNKTLSVLSAFFLISKFSYANCPGREAMTGLETGPNLVELFENMACSGLGEVNSHEMLDKMYCRAIGKCDDALLKKPHIPVSEMNYLKLEAKLFLVREITTNEMAKFFNENNEPFLKMVNFSKKLPGKFQARIKSCASAVSETAKTCALKDDKATQMMQLQITDLQIAHTKKAHDDYANNLRKGEEAEAVAKMARVIADGDNFSNVYRKIKLQEQDREEARKGEEVLTSQNDPILNRIYTNWAKFVQNNEGKTFTQEDVKKTLMKSFSEAAESLRSKTSDDIVKYGKNNHAIIARAINELNLSVSDLDSNARDGLFDKINEVRVGLVNSHFQNDCSKINLSIDQVCSNIVAKVEKGTANEILAGIINNPFPKIMASYENSDLKSKNKNLDQLKKFHNSSSDVYLRYFTFAIQNNICAEKYPDERVSIDNREARERAEGLSKLENERINEMRESVSNNRRETIAALRETASKNEFFHKEIINLGVNLNADTARKEMHSLDNSQTAMRNDVARQTADEVSSYKTSVVNNNYKVSNNAENIEQMPPQSFNRFNDFNTAEKINDLPEDSREVSYKKKLADLESRERALAKKGSLETFSNQDKAEDDGILGDLKKQIEELKRNQVSASQGNEVKVPGPGQEAKSSNTKDVAGEVKAMTSGTKPGVESLDENEQKVSATDNSANKLGQAESVSAPNGSARSQAAALSPNSNSFGIKNVDKSNTGIIFTKSGDVLQDPSKILENPKDGDIIKLLEVTKGEAFLIKENGVLLKVVPEFDRITGKSFTKKALSRAEQEIIAREGNLLNRFKELSHGPARLLSLKKIFHKAVERD